MVSATVHAEDVPIVQLKPLSERKISRREYERIKASIEAVGLIEPLVVSPENGSFLILDGVQRYRILLDLGVEAVPCILRQEKETFTCNRMVNHISPVQESRMIEKSLEELDVQTIASALGLNTISHRLNKTLISQLHPAVAEALDAGSITRACAREFTHAKPERQLDILTMMKAHNDFSIAFARALILKTPPKLRARKRRNSSNPWNRAERKKNELLKKLQDAEQKHDFYSRLYRQYSVDLLKLVIYGRSLITNPSIREYVDEHHPGIVARFLDIIALAEA